jgi:hypothetical protein
MQNIDHVIRERAYYLWIADGCPEGKSDAYWLDAQRALLAQSVAALPAPAAKAPAKARPAKKLAGKSRAKTTAKAKAKARRKAA